MFFSTLDQALSFSKAKIKAAALSFSRTELLNLSLEPPLLPTSMTTLSNPSTTPHHTTVTTYDLVTHHQSIYYFYLWLSLWIERISSLNGGNCWYFQLLSKYRVLLQISFGIKIGFVSSIEVFRFKLVFKVIFMWQCGMCKFRIFFFLKWHDPFARPTLKRNTYPIWQSNTCNLFIIV